MSYTPPATLERLRPRKRNWLASLPKWLRHRLIRRAVHFPWQRLEGLSVEIAHDERAYEAAFRLVHDAYVERGWINPQPSGMWRTAHHALPESTVLVMRAGAEYVGTVTLVLDSELGLPIDATFPDEVAQRRAPGRRLVEVGSLAVAPAVRRSGAWLCLAVAMWRHAVCCLGASDVVVALDAPVADYYEALFGFRRFTDVRHYRGFGQDVSARNDDPVVGLWQDTKSMRRFNTLTCVDAPHGHYNAFALYALPYPASFELVPSSASLGDMVRFKLPRRVFQRFFVAADSPLDGKTREYLARSRSRATLTGSVDSWGVELASR